VDDRETKGILPVYGEGGGHVLCTDKLEGLVARPRKRDGECWRQCSSRERRRDRDLGAVRKGLPVHVEIAILAEKSRAPEKTLLQSRLEESG